jgi:hypothetical protein
MHKTIKTIGKKLPIVDRLAQQTANMQTEIGILQLEKGDLEATIREKNTLINSKRNFLAERYISGHGIEIGAAQLPVRLPAKASVKYVDVFTADELREAFPLYKKLRIVDIDVVDDGEKLDKFKDNSLDFIIANHFLEH